MTQSHRIPVQMFGQSGCRLNFPDATIYCDPYLSNSVQVLHAPDLERQVPILVPPENIADARCAELPKAARRRWPSDRGRCSVPMPSERNKRSLAWALRVALASR